MKARSGIVFVAIILLIAAAVYFSIAPISGINLGLDLQGGASVLLQAVPDEGKSITADDMSKLMAVMRSRVDEFGVSEPVLQLEGTDRLHIELAGVDNPDRAIELLGKTAKLEFRDPLGVVLLDGADLTDAQAVITNNEPSISLSFTNEGTKKFAAATTRLVGMNIDIYLDNVRISGGNVKEPILNGNASISGGNMTYQDAADTAALLRGGALPVSIEVLSKNTIGPTLGADSLDKSLLAMLIGLLLLAVFIIGYYRLPGVIACVSLTVYSLLLLWALKLIGATLTLPGIAGFVLSVGMAVDANIIIYERVKEELRAGKSLKAGIDAGFKHAFWTIFDSNLTTLLAALVLFKFGSGSIQGFAVTLSLGLIASMFTAITFTHYMLKLCANIKPFAKKALYGVKEVA